MTQRGEESPIPHDEALLLLPWYISGRLSDALARRVQQHIAGCKSCSEDASMQSALKDSIGSTPAIEYTPHASLAKLMERIEAQKCRRTAWLTWIPRLAPSSSLPPRSAKRWVRTLAIATSVQAAAIIALLAAVGWFAMRSVVPSSYQTLTATAEERSTSGVLVRVVFEDSFRIAELRSLLYSMDARIVAGPTSVGAYTIELDVRSRKAISAAAVAESLRMQPGVRFAEPIVGRE